MKKLIFLFCFLVPILLGGCSSTTHIGAKLTDEQVDQFISEKAINVVTFKQLNSGTVVLYRNDNKYGHYFLYLDNEKNIRNEHVEKIVDYTNKIFLGGVSTVREPFLTVIIIDENLQQTAKYIEVTFDDGSLVKEDILNGGAIISCKNDKDKLLQYSKVEVFDENNVAEYSLSFSLVK